MRAPKYYLLHRQHPVDGKLINVIMGKIIGRNLTQATRTAFGDAIEFIDHEYIPLFESELPINVDGLAQSLAYAVLGLVWP